MDLSALRDNMDIILAFISVCITAYTVYLTSRYRSEVAFSEQIANVPKILSEDYLTRCFVPPLSIGDKKIHSFRDARVHVQNAIKTGADKTESEARSGFLKDTLSYGTWQNKFAYEVSVGLERVGLMLLAGGLPAALVFEEAAFLIIEDWGYCSTLVKEKMRRGSDSLMPMMQMDVKWMGFQRGHAEWLAYACALYASKYWKGEHLDILLSQIGDLDTIRERERILRHFYSDIIPPSTKKKIDLLIT